MLVIALLLLGVPVLLLLIAFGLVPAGPLSDSAGALGNLPQAIENADNQTRVIAGVASALVAILALVLFLRELAVLVPQTTSNLFVNQEAGRETKITPKAVKALTEGAAQEVGAFYPSVSLASRKNEYRVSCKIQAAPASNVSELAAQTRDNIQRVLESQDVPVRDVEVTVRGTAS
jgi:hypothetical protein